MDAKPGLINLWKEKVRQLKFQAYTLYFAYRDPRTPWYAKAFAALVVAYAFSPIDLIPDFIPVLGYLDDLILIPLGVILALRMIPPEIIEQSEARAKQALDEVKPKFKFMGAVIIGVWVVVGLLVAYWLARRLFLH